MAALVWADVQEVLYIVGPKQSMNTWSTISMSGALKQTTRIAALILLDKKGIDSFVPRSI